MELACRPNINDFFKNGITGRGLNSKHRRVLESLQWRQAYQNKDFYEYVLEDGDTRIRVSQIPNGELKGLGTGTFCWPAAHVLAKYIELRWGTACTSSTDSNSCGLIDRNVCELGSGTGLTGIVTACLGAQVTLTDQSIILDLLQSNATKAASEYPSKIVNPIHVCEFDWLDCKPISQKPFDLLIVSDCVLPKLYPMDLLINVSNDRYLVNSSKII